MRHVLLARGPFQRGAALNPLVAGLFDRDAFTVGNVHALADVDADLRVKIVSILFAFERLDMAAGAGAIRDDIALARLAFFLALFRLRYPAALSN